MKHGNLILRSTAAALCILTLLFCAGCATQPEQMQPGSCYITEACLYRSPLSAIFWGDDDNGLLYCIEETAFSWHLRDNPAADFRQIDNVHWGWQDFPYTDSEWNAMLEPSDLFNHAAIENINARYQNPMYQPLAEHMMLLQLDTEIWLVTMTPIGTDDNPWQIESIHTLVQETE